jgi:hypothetical protein
MPSPLRTPSISNGTFNVMYRVLVELIRIVNNAFLIASSAPILGYLIFDKHCLVPLKMSSFYNCILAKPNVLHNVVNYRGIIYNPTQYLISIGTNIKPWYHIGYGIQHGLCDPPNFTLGWRQTAHTIVVPQSLYSSAAPYFDFASPLQQHVYNRFPSLEGLLILTLNIEVGSWHCMPILNHKP